MDDNKIIWAQIPEKSSSRTVCKKESTQLFSVTGLRVFNQVHDNAKMTISRRNYISSALTSGRHFVSPTLDGFLCLVIRITWILTVKVEQDFAGIFLPKPPAGSTFTDINKLLL